MSGKSAQSQIPYCEDQGISNLAGAFARGVSIQHAIFEMVSSPDDFVFADEGLSSMADATYVVYAQNQTDSTDQAKADGKTTLKFTINGPDIGDVVDLVIVGRLKGQLA